MNIKRPSKHQGIQSILTVIIVSVFLSLMTPMSYANTLAARLNRNKITAGETVSLSIVLPQTGNQSGNTQPDLTPLAKDFQVLGTGTSSQVQIINGKRSDSREISITLMPKQQGTLEIPAIKVGQDSTEPLTLTVTAAPTIDSAQAGNPVWLEIESPLKNQDVMVNQEIPLTVRLFSALQLRDISLSQPDPANAVVEKLGDAKQYQAERDGKNYQVIEQRYAIFPEKAGALTIPPVVLRAMVPDQQQARNTRTSPFDDPFFKDTFGANSSFGSGFGSLLNNSFFSNPFNRGKPLTLGSDGMKFYVEHIPEVAKGQSWLPSSKVTLEGSWKDNPPEFKSGEPVTLTVTVKAEGLSGSQIPGLNFPQTKNLRVYNEPAQNESFSDGEHITGISTQTFTLIPEYAGEFKLPELTLPWWNINKQSMQTASLAARTITVVQGNGAAMANKPLTTNQTSNTPTGNTHSVSQTSASSPTGISQINQALIQKDKWLGVELDVILLILLALGAVLAFFILKKRRTLDKPESGIHSGHSNTQPATVSNTVNQGLLKNLKQEFMQACEQNNAQQAAKTLLQWAQQTWPENPPTSLKIIADNLDRGAKPVSELHRYLYESRPDEQAWQGQELAGALTKGLVRKAPKNKQTDPETLLPLYPT